ncbi:hypothetical protein ACFLZ6_00500 [Nanoarchaeota archaeon]
MEFKPGLILGLFTKMKLGLKKSKRWVLFSFIIIFTLTSAIYLVDYIPKEGEEQSFVQTEVFEYDEDWLRQLILAEFPEIANPKISDLEKVNMIRDWAAANTDLSAKREFNLDVINNSNPYSSFFDYYNQDAPSIYSAFMDDKGGVWCAGTTYALARLYDLFGFESVMVHLDIPEGIGFHAFNLVKIEDKKKEIFSIQDAYFNITYVHKDGTNMGYFELIELLQERKHNEVTVMGSLSSGPMRESIAFDDGKLIKVRKNMFRLSEFEIGNKELFLDFYEEYSYPHNNLYTFLAFGGLYKGTESEETRAEFLSKIDKYGLTPT